MQHLDIIDLFKNKREYIASKVTVCGWVKTFRQSKTVSFAEINDGSQMQNLQLVLGEQFSKLNLGCGILAYGEVVTAFNNKDNIELNVERIELLGDCPLDYPLQKKGHSMEFLRNISHLRVRTNTFGAMFRLRSKVSFAIHEFFQKNNFFYVHTPIITGSDCEGAGEIFKVTTNSYNHKYKTEEEYNQNDFFGKSAGLTVSGQLEGEVIAMALGKIYTFGPTFRAENSNTSRHAAEFWQIEPEVAFAQLDDIIVIATEMIKYITNYALTNCKEELEFFDKHFEKGLIQKLEKLVASDFVKLDYTKAIEILKNSNKKFDYAVEWGLDLQTEHERYLVDEYFKAPVFVVNYPKEIKSFYMKQNEDGKTVAATDLLVPGVGEIIGCSEREADLDKLKEAIISRNMKLSDYENYLDLRKFGSVPHSGFGLGLERFLMYITGIGNIRDTQIFARAKGELR